MNEYPAPNLIIEIANTFLADYQRKKRLLYEDLAVDEYWIVDVQNVRIIAFAVANGGSERITVSQVLPGLAISQLSNFPTRRSAAAYPSDESRASLCLVD